MRYSIFQEAVRELSKEIEYGDTKEKGIYPIEFDFMVWRIAKVEENKWTDFFSFCVVFSTQIRSIR